MRQGQPYARAGRTAARCGADHDALGPSPFIATWLLATYGSPLPISIYILICAVIGIIATALLTDYTNRDIPAEYAGV